MEDELVVAEDDQEFLQRHKNTLEVKDQVNTPPFIFSFIFIYLFIYLLFICYYI